MSEELEETEGIDVNSRRWACAAHLTAVLGIIVSFVLGIMVFFAPAIGPIAIWFFKRKQNLYIEEQARRSVNFQLSMCLYYLIAVGASQIPIIGWLLILLTLAIQFIQGILPLVAALRAYEGDEFNYPFSISFIKDSTPKDSVPQIEEE